MAGSSVFEGSDKWWSIECGDKGRLFPRVYPLRRLLGKRPDEESGAAEARDAHGDHHYGANQQLVDAIAAVWRGAY
jgi:hypothetical protein